MPRERIKPSGPDRPFYDEEGYLLRNPYLPKLLEDFPRRVIHPTQALARKGQWKTWLGGKPLHLEVGPGKGRWFTDYALAHPEAAMLGIEVKFRRVYKIAKRLDYYQVPDAWLLRFDGNYLDWVFGENEVDAMFVHFPDPWWKKERQRYRGMVTPEFIAKAEHFLAPGGHLTLKTDHPERFEMMQEAVRTSSLKILAETTDLAHSPYVKDNIETIFEEKFRLRGIPTCYLLAEK